MKTTSAWIGILVAVAGLGQACRGDDAIPPLETAVLDPESLTARIDSIAHQALSDGPVAGLSIAVFRGSEAVFTKGYGFADFEAGIPATADTKYDIASVSKLLTALAVMKLVEEGNAVSTYTGTYAGDRYYDRAISEGVVPDARELFRIVENDGHLERIVLTGDTRTPLELIYKGDHSFGRADWPMDRFVFHVEDRRARGYSEYYNGIFATFNRRAKP